MMQSPFDFALAAPEIFLLVMGMVILVLDALSSDPRRTLAYGLSLFTLVGLMLLSGLQIVNGMIGASFSGLFVVDQLSYVLKIASYIAVFATLVYSREYLQSRDMLRGGEFYVLVLFALLGQMIMISGSNFLSIYLGLELMSLALYALVALRRDNATASEAARIFGSVTSTCPMASPALTA